MTKWEFYNGLGIAGLFGAILGGLLSPEWFGQICWFASLAALCAGFVYTTTHAPHEKNRRD